jgi:hypothetical protein
VASYGGALRPVAKLVHRAINKVRDADQAATAARNVDGVSPGSTIARAMARTLEGSGEFNEIRILEREPTGEDRPRDDGALVRVTVPAWGVIRVREGDPDLVSGFADVQAQMVMGRTGVVVWDGSEDVTHPESAPLASFVRNRDFARETMIGLLERAGSGSPTSSCMRGAPVGDGQLARTSTVLLTVLLPLVSGCGTAGLDVHYPEARVNRTVLASAPPRRVEVGPVADRRMEHDTHRGQAEECGRHRDEPPGGRPRARGARPGVDQERPFGGVQRAGCGPGRNGRGFPAR